MAQVQTYLDLRLTAVEPFATAEGTMAPFAASAPTAVVADWVVADGRPVLRWRIGAR